MMHFGNRCCNVLSCNIIYIETDTESAEYRLKVIGTISEK